MKTTEEIIARLKAIAKEKGISTYKIAEITGMKQSNISRVFSEKYNPNLKTVCEIAKALNVEIEIIEPIRN